MTTFEYVLNFALVGLVVLQVRGVTLTKAALLVPVVMTAWAATQVLHSVPTGGNDVALEAGSPASRWVCWPARRPACGGSARLRWREQARAGALRVAGLGTRVGFPAWVQHGGAAAVRQFSVAHHITGGPAWGTGFVLMALTEVVSRTSVLWVKARRCGAAIERGGLIRLFATT